MAIRIDSAISEGHLRFPTAGEAVVGNYAERGGRLARTRGAVRSYLGTTTHAVGKRWAGEAFGIGTRGIGRVLGIGFAAYTIGTGYQQGGAWGATKALAGTAAEMYAFGAIKGALFGNLGLSALAPVAAVAAGGAFVFRKELSRPWVREHMKKHAKLEMGRPVMDQFGNLSTMRQRSLAAIQSSKINGRSGLGNEAALMYRPYFR